MTEINLTLTIETSPEQIDRIMQISNGIKITDAAAIAKLDYKGDLSARKEMDLILQTTDILYGNKKPNNLIARSPELKWIQLPFAGVDRYLDDNLVKSGITVTNARGIHATAITEYILTYMLMFAKQMPLLHDMQRRHEYHRAFGTFLRGKTAGILGLGSIGKETARICKSFGMRVIALRRHTGRSKTRNVDMILPPERLTELLSESDFVVVCLPLTPSTEDMIGKTELSAMKKTACIINIGRGRVVNEDALIQALEDKTIAGAGLDVFATEPLPPDSKFWKLDNVIITPHVSGDYEDYYAVAFEVFIENLKRYVNGKRLRNIVNKKLGY